MTATATDTLSHAKALSEMILKGEILDAVDRYYADDAQMQENGNTPTVGKPAIIEHEKKFLSTVKEWKNTEFTAIAADGDTALLEYNFEFINTNGDTVRYEQVSVQKWRNGQIVHERFYYDSGA